MNLSNIEGFGLLCGHLVGDYLLQNDWMANGKKLYWWPCAVHCSLYTLAVFSFSFWWISVPLLMICWSVHYAIDRWGFVKWYMAMMGQAKFSQPPMSPWSIVVVDNTFHLVTLFVLAVMASHPEASTFPWGY